MLIHDDLYTWDGWGGKLKLGSGECRLRIYDLTKGDTRAVPHLKPIVVIVSDVPDPENRINKMTVRSCAGHIATHVVRDFDIDPNRMIWVEDYSCAADDDDCRESADQFQQVEFSWHEPGAIHPAWKTLKPPLLDLVRALASDEQEGVTDG
ncbi:hypothetical protein DENIS_4539 [Desulfonema ishimotonii]|uniref:Uncharacterized protein n=1 Tax=Desulfonema ishimotonii TaxID=45657 RepID=A0A401G2Y8_9BACT|nr:hypothetical protein [Desulfonema ishimotonii]GBC63541.1 hypothetical protein DENIS_4539 [Desulfonema ishimotonii]